MRYNTVLVHTDRPQIMTLSVHDFDVIRANGSHASSRRPSEDHDAPPPTTDDKSIIIAVLSVVILVPDYDSLVRTSFSANLLACSLTLKASLVDSKEQEASKTSVKTTVVITFRSALASYLSFKNFIVQVI